MDKINLRTANSAILIMTIVLFLNALAPQVAMAKDIEGDFIEKLIEERIPVSVYLVNGIKLQGQISQESKEVIFLRNHVHQMVYKNAISNIVPARDVSSE